MEAYWIGSSQVPMERPRGVLERERLPPPKGPIIPMEDAFAVSRDGKFTCLVRFGEAEPKVPVAVQQWPVQSPQAVAMN